MTTDALKTVRGYCWAGRKAVDLPEHDGMRLLTSPYGTVHILEKYHHEKFTLHNLSPGFAVRLGWGLICHGVRAWWRARR